jgi:hypothetical protein
MKERSVQLEHQISPEEIEQTLRRTAEERYGPRRAQELEGRLQNTARWLARIADAPVDFATDPPDHTGLDGEDR